MPRTSIYRFWILFIIITLLGNGLAPCLVAQTFEQSTQLPPGPLKSIKVTKGTIRLTVAKNGGAFTHPVNATINGLAFPDVIMEREKLAKCFKDCMDDSPRG